MEMSCGNCRKKDSCQRPIRQMASDEELEHIVCIEHEGTKTKSFTVKIQSNGYPLIMESCELSDEELERVVRLFQTMLDNRRRR